MTTTKTPKLVAIVIPLSNRTELTAAEQISLRHLLHHLGTYDKYFIAPHGLAISHPEVQNKYFDQKYFGSAEAHSKLLLSSLFYKAFKEYKYILIYHLDSLVFSDQLTEWCQQGYDYIAPPWIKHEDAPYAGMTKFEGKVGNGGFSLRRIESFIKVIDSNKYYIDPDKYWQQFCKNRSKLKQLVNLPRKYIKRISKFNNAKKEIDEKITIEDMFWANRGKYYYPEFKIAPIEIALKFAFECVPHYCYEQNGHQLPFGCHAWEKYEKSFWEPFLLPDAICHK
ncbi:DUF5672 family protein [Desulfocastanea catecholica]